MNAQLLARLPTVGAEPRAAQAASAIGSAVSSQAQIIDDLLDLSRINTGKMALAATSLDLAELVHDIANRSAPSAPI